MGTILEGAPVFKAKREEARRREDQAVNEIIKSIGELRPESAAALVAAIESAAEYIKTDRQYNYFADSYMLAALIWVLYSEPQAMQAWRALFGQNGDDSKRARR